MGADVTLTSGGGAGGVVSREHPSARHTSRHTARPTARDYAALSEMSMRATGRGMTNRDETFALCPIGWVRSELRTRADAPMQGYEAAPDAWIDIEPDMLRGLEGIAVGDEIVVLTWLHQSRRDVLRVHPRSDPTNPLTGVFATRSPDRPNPIGLHRVRVRELEPGRLRVGPLEAIDGTPVVDIKPVLERSTDH